MSHQGSVELELHQFLPSVEDHLHLVALTDNLILYGSRVVDIVGAIGVYGHTLLCVFDRGILFSVVIAYTDDESTAVFRIDVVDSLCVLLDAALNEICPVYAIPFVTTCLRQNIVYEWCIF